MSDLDQPESPVASQPPTDIPVSVVPGEPSSTPETKPEKKPADKPKGTFTKRQLIIASVAAGVIIISGTALAFALHHKPAKTAVLVKKTVTPPPPTPAPTPTMVTDPVTGYLVTPAVAAQPVAGVMIENLYPYARPQSGLSQAGIVYEALAEGGITRFLAIFQQPFPGVMGPVRSLRPYYLDWGLERGIPIAHAGGSQPALAEIVPLGLKNINALEYDGSYFYRISTRFAPHNLYTNSVNFTKLVAKLGFATAPTFPALPRKDDAPAKVPEHTDIKIPFSYTAYNAEYKYNAAANDYLRFEGGAPQTDQNTGKQIEVKNLAVEFIPVSYGTQDDGDPFTNYHLIGSGKLLVFEDGNAIVGTWSKTADAAPTQLLDSNGNPIVFNRGNIWISVVPTGTNVTY
ncbi:MAG TPA: DUF3048 domain-containing protein [Candidatus Saccharimonadia bacterium]|nr:DUF3048 domain-containing protein [Candidatus Saccharimonadia bacterium]